MTDTPKRPCPRRSKKVTPPATPLIPPKLAWLTEEWNRLVPEAQRLGIGVRAHTSPFESRAVAERRLAWLRTAMAAARKK